jgi:hypothetical protein
MFREPKVKSAILVVPLFPVCEVKRKPAVRTESAPVGGFLSSRMADAGSVGKGLAEKMQRDGSDRLEAVRADLRERVIRRVPWVVLKIDDVDGRNARDKVQRHVIVEHRTVKDAESAAAL